MSDNNAKTEHKHYFVLKNVHSKLYITKFDYLDTYVKVVTKNLTYAVHYKTSQVKDDVHSVNKGTCCLLSTISFEAFQL